MKRLQYFLICIGIFCLVSNHAYCQSQEMDKLKSLIEKGNLEKAQAYCDKVTAPMSEKTAGKFFSAMGNAYYNKKDYDKAAEMVQKSEDFKLSAKLAKEFDAGGNATNDKDLAIKLYIKGKNNDRAAQLLYEQGKYDEASETCSSIDNKMKYGDSLYSKGKIDESILFYKRAKNKGQKFSNEPILKYVYDKKAYSTAYAIQAYNEPEFKMTIQGSVIDKMVEYNESPAFIKNFLDSIRISKNKQDEIFIEAYLNNKQLDKAEAYCMERNGSDQQICLSFLADKTSETYPEISASANFKLGKSFLAQDLLTTYMIETAKPYNGKWNKEPIDKKLLQEFLNKTKKPIEKCGQKYCEFLLFSAKKCKNKADDMAKSDSNKATELAHASVFMMQVSGVLCK